MNKLFVAGLAVIVGIAAMSFTCGLGAIESDPDLKLTPEKMVRQRGRDPAPVDKVQPVVVILPVSGAITPAPDLSRTSPDTLLIAATTLVTASLRQDQHLPTRSPGRYAELIESVILPLFNFRRMTELAVARDWRLASPDQQVTLIAEFRTLLVRTYSRALGNYRDQAIVYKPLRMAPGDSEVTVKSTIKQPGAERMSIDYDMEMTAAGWKVYDIKIGGISLVTTYRSSFAQALRDGGVEGLIKSLSNKNLQSAALSGSEVSGPRYLLFIYSVLPDLFRNDR